MNQHSQSGFTLAEIAIAFVIIALLLAGSLIPFASQVELKNYSDTRRTMDQIKEALIGFVQINGRLPCPARGATRFGTTDNSYGESFSAGVEQLATIGATAGSCYTAVGVIPWSTLGVSETDAWGRRFTYRVAPAFADNISRTTWNSRLTDPGVSQSLSSPASPANQWPTCPSTDPSSAPSPTPTTSSFALCTLGDIAILTRSDSNHATVTTLGSGLPVVFVSHGKNGNGAWQPNGVQINAAAANTDELANSSGTNTGTPTNGYTYLSYVFYSRNQSPTNLPCDDTSGTAFCEFDDIVHAIPTSTLIARTVAAGRLP